MNTKTEVTILGGGSAGWLTALFINRNWPHLKINVIENPKKPPIIAGESGSTTFTDFLMHLKIDKEDFIKNTNATPKLGGKFVDWNGVGTEFLHVMQTDFSPWLEHWDQYIDGVDHRDLSVRGLSNYIRAKSNQENYLKIIIANDIPLAKMFHANEFIRQNKVPFGASSTLPCVPMWHFESRGAAAYFKKIGLERGINLVEGEYASSLQDSVGNVIALILEDHRQISGDWFIDCTGFNRLLLKELLKEEIVDYSHYFPARAVVAWWDEPCPCLTTNATAMKYGWSWNINLRHRSGNGYLYDPDFITLDQAVDEAEKRFNKTIEPIANFQFTPGIMKNAWQKNVIAVGLSSGFLEPLEANGVAVIVETLYAMHDLWSPDGENNQEIRQKFNHRTFHITEDIKDFLALHYRGHRNDSDFWQMHKSQDRVPDSLKEKLEKWSAFFSSDQLEPYFNGYSPTAWLMVLQGLEIFDNDYLKNRPDILKNNKDFIINNVEKRFKNMVDPFWTLDEWLRKTA